MRGTLPVCMGILTGLLILMPLQVLPEDPLSLHRQWIGSPREKKIIQYTRACILHALDPARGEPEKISGLQDLPRTGLYLTLMRGRKVRVCLGSFSPNAFSMEDAIQDLARRVTYGDTRSPPLCLEEMDTLSIVLSFVGPLQEISDPRAVDFTTQGLYVCQEGKGGVLLPGETKTLSYGLHRLLKQMGIDPERPCRYATFEVVAFDERLL